MGKPQVDATLEQDGAEIKVELTIQLPDSQAEDAADTADGEDTTQTNTENDTAPKGWTKDRHEKLKKGEIKGEFAGPDMSFPIASPADVSDAWNLAGHADDPEAVRRKIVSIAVKYGWTSGLPNSARKWAEDHNVNLKYGDVVNSQDITFHMQIKSWGNISGQDALVVEGYANTNVTDRVGDLVEPDAFRGGLDAYMKNPIVLFNHDIHKPIGKVIEAAIDNVGLKVKVAIDRTLEWGSRVADMVTKGILNAFSIRARNDQANGWVDATGVRRIVNWDLQEISVVTVPANQQALFSIAKAMDFGNDLVARDVPIVQNGGNMNDQTVARENVVPSQDEIIMAVMKRLDDKAAVEKAAAEKEAAERAVIEQEVRAKLEAEYAAKAEAATKNFPAFPAKPPFPVASPAGNATDDTDFRRKWGEIQVTSKYDRMGDTDLLMRLYVQNYANAIGRADKPSERLHRAAMVRAAKFMRNTDKIAVMGRNGPELQEVPAFDMEAIRPLNSGDTYDVAGVDGKVLAKDLPFKDNVTNAGIAQLIEIGAKSNELAYSTQANYGDEWVPTLMSAALWRTIRLEANVLPLIPAFDMPSNPYDLPTEGSDPTFYLVGEAADESQLVISGGPFTDSKVGTGKVTFTANKIGAMSYWSEEFGEDSATPVEAQYRDQFAIKMAHTLDELLISGDETGGGSTANISYWGSALSAPSRFLVLDGLRHQPLVTTTSDARDAGTLTIDDINATRALMGPNGVYAANPNDLLIICDLPTKYKFEDLSEVLTLDKFGPLAVVLRGQLGSVKNIPIVATQDYGLTDTSGYINATGASNTKGSFMIVNRNMVRVGWKRRPRILVGQVPYSDAFYILATARLDVGFFAPGAVAMSYNITV